MNIKNYQSMVIGQKRNLDDMNMRIGGVEIEHSKQMKLLGVNIDSDLNFTNDISPDWITCRCKGKPANWNTYKAKESNIYPCQITTIQAAILPHVTHCSTAWHFCRASDKRKLKRLQERAIRMVLTVDWTHIRIYFSSLTCRLCITEGYRT